MSAATRENGQSACGPWLENLRVYLQLTQQEIARIASVTSEQVNRLEHNEPLPPDIRYRIMRALGSMRLRNWKLLLNC